MHSCRQTPKLHFKALVNDGALAFLGVVKGTWYERAAAREQPEKAGS